MIQPACRPTFNDDRQPEHLHLRPRHERDTDGHRPANREAPPRDDDQILHLRVPLPLDDDALRLLGVVFSGAGYNGDALLRGEFRLERAGAVHDRLELPRDRAVVDLQRRLQVRPLADLAEQVPDHAGLDALGLG